MQKTSLSALKPIFFGEFPPISRASSPMSSKHSQVDLHTKIDKKDNLPIMLIIFRIVSAVSHRIVSRQKPTSQPKESTYLIHKNSCDYRRGKAMQQSQE